MDLRDSSDPLSFDRTADEYLDRTSTSPRSAQVTVAVHPIPTLATTATTATTVQPISTTVTAVAASRVPAQQRRSGPPRARSLRFLHSTSASGGSSDDSPTDTKHSATSPDSDGSGLTPVPLIDLSRPSSTGAGSGDVRPSLKMYRSRSERSPWNYKARRRNSDPAVVTAGLGIFKPALISGEVPMNGTTNTTGRHRDASEVMVSGVRDTFVAMNNRNRAIAHHASNPALDENLVTAANRVRRVLSLSSRWLASTDCL